MPVPFVDLSRAQADVDPDLRAAYERVAASTRYMLGPEVDSFESEFADYCGSVFCIGTSDGTEALRIALLALGVEPGQEVIAPAMTYIATIEAIDLIGAKPVLVDVDEQRLISSAGVHQALTTETAAIVPVHLYGRLAEIPSVAEGARVKILEDAAQAHGASLDGRRAGAFGDAAAFSFYPSKNLGALGDGGAITTSDAEVAERARSLRMHGTVPGDPNRHVRRGGATGRLDALQAAFLSAKLPHLDDWTAQRRAAAALYGDALADLPLELPPGDPEDGEQVFHLYVVLVPDDVDRDAVLAGLRAAGIGAQVHYPTAPHLQPALAHLGYARGDFPQAERIAAQAISLPMFPGITEAEVAEVADALRAALP